MHWAEGGAHGTAVSSTALWRGRACPQTRGVRDDLRQRRTGRELEAAQGRDVEREQLLSLMERVRDERPVAAVACGQQRELASLREDLWDVGRQEDLGRGPQVVSARDSGSGRASARTHNLKTQQRARAARNVNQAGRAAGGGACTAPR